MVIDDKTRYVTLPSSVGPVIPILHVRTYKATYKCIYTYVGTCSRVAMSEHACSKLTKTLAGMCHLVNKHFRTNYITKAYKQLIQIHITQPRR